MNNFIKTPLSTTRGVGVSPYTVGADPDASRYHREGIGADFFGIPTKSGHTSARCGCSPWNLFFRRGSSESFSLFWMNFSTRGGSESSFRISRHQ